MAALGEGALAEGGTEAWDLASLGSVGGFGGPGFGGWDVLDEGEGDGRYPVLVLERGDAEKCTSTYPRGPLDLARSCCVPDAVAGFSGMAVLWSGVAILLV